MKPKSKSLGGTHNVIYGGKWNSSPTSKPHPTRKAWWRERHCLGFYFAASGPGQLAIINRKINLKVYQDVLQKNVRQSVRQLKLKGGQMLQQDNDSKHTSKSTSEWFQKNKIKVLGWPSQSPDLNPIEMLWHDLKTSIRPKHPRNLTEMQQFSKEEWSKK